MTETAHPSSTAARVTAGWSSTTVPAADGTTLHVWRTGRPGGTPIVLAHGLSDDGRCWWRVVDALVSARDDLDLLMPDARNHGRSGTGDNAADLLASDVVSVLDVLDIDVVTGVGHSMGARTLGHVASVRPERVGQLVLADPPWRIEAEHDATFTANDREAVRAWIDSLRNADDEELTAIGRRQHPDWPADELPTWAESSRLVRPEAADIDGRVSWGDIVGRLSCPTLLLYGDAERGGIVTDELAQRITDRHPNLTAHRVDGAGHNLHREQFEEFVRVLLEHLPDHGRRGQGGPHTP